MADSYVQRQLDQAKLIVEELPSVVAPDGQKQLRLELIHLLSDPNNAIRQGVLDLMKRLGAEMNRPLIESLLLPAAACTDGAILALADMNRWSGDEIKTEAVSVIAPFLDSPAGGLKRAAMIALRILNTKEAQSAMRGVLNANGSGEDLVELSWTREASLIPFILEHTCGGILESKDNIPFYVANLANAAWVADRLHETDTLLIAEGFGYVDTAVVDILAKGAGAESNAGIKRLLDRVGIVSGEMLGTYLDAGVHRDELLSRWEERVQEIANHLLPDGLVGKRGIDPIGLGDDREERLSRHLLFAGMRLADTWSFEAKLELSPFKSKGGSQVAGGFYFKSFELFEGAYLSKATQAARSLFEPHTSSEELGEVLLPYIVLSYALIGAETRADESVEARYLFEGQWRTLAKVLEVEDRRLIVGSEYTAFVDLPVGAELEDRVAVNHFIESMRGLENQHLIRFSLLDVEVVRGLDDFMEFAQSREGWFDLSYGAQSALKVFAYELMNSIGGGEITDAWQAEFEAISDEEKRYAGVLPSLGIEIQSTSVSEQMTFAWKESLEYFGIPSPRRPEFHEVVEPALRPLYSPRACLLLIRTLHNFGIHENYNRGSALHYSVAGDLGDEAKYLAIGLRSFVTERSERALTENGWYRSLARVMSKGLIHRNPDSVAVRAGEERPPCHTEIRVLRLQNHPDGSARLDPACEVYVPGGQMLAAAALTALDPGGDPQLAEIWKNYREEIRGLYLDRKFDQGRLLDASWHEATGDPDDAELVGGLPVIQAFVEAREFFKEHPGRAEELRVRTNELFCSAVGEVLSYLK